MLIKTRWQLNRFNPYENGKPLTSAVDVKHRAVHESKGITPMIALSLTRLAAATGGLALSLTAGIGAAAADPLDPAVNTTCNYSQVVAAMDAQSPATAAQFNATPAAQSFLQQFLASPPPQREQMLQQAQETPEAAPFVNMVEPLANACNNY